MNDTENFIKKNTILRVVSGSHAYGTNLPTSDWDERGIFVDSAERVILPFEKLEQFQFEKDDVTIFELSKFIPLLLSQNPNIVEIVWASKEDILEVNEFGQLILDNKKHFLSKQIKDSYVGYALSQLKRIKGHNKWINNKQSEEKPDKRDFLSVVWNYSNIKEFNKKVPIDNFVAIDLGDNHFSLWSTDRLKLNSQSWFDKVGNPLTFDISEFSKINKDNISPDMIVKFNYKLYEDTFNNWKSYWTWKKNRNEKRSKLEEQFGYDTKHAMHLIRLLKMGYEILETGVVNVKRSDKDYLLDIRNGVYSYEEIVKESEILQNKINLITSKSNLPEKPNLELAKEIMLHIYKKKWSI